MKYFKIILMSLWLLSFAFIVIKLLNASHVETMIGFNILLLYVLGPVGSLAFFSFGLLNFFEIKNENFMFFYTLFALLMAGVVAFYQWFIFIPKLWNMFRAKIRKKI